MRSLHDAELAKHRADALALETSLKNAQLAAEQQALENSKKLQAEKDALAVSHAEELAARNRAAQAERAAQEEISKKLQAELAAKLKAQEEELSARVLAQQAEALAHQQAMQKELDAKAKVRVLIVMCCCCVRVRV